MNIRWILVFSVIALSSNSVIAVQPIIQLTQYDEEVIEISREFPENSLSNLMQIMYSITIRLDRGSGEVLLDTRGVFRPNPIPDSITDDQCDSILDAFLDGITDRDKMYRPNEESKYIDQKSQLITLNADVVPQTGRIPIVWGNAEINLLEKAWAIQCHGIIYY
jgi:hypothetical protein